MAGDALGSSETLTRAVKLRSGAAMRPGGLDEGGRPAMELRRVGGGAGNPGEVPTTCWREEERAVGVLR